MTAIAEKIRAEALQLSETERAQLAHSLILSLEDSAHETDEDWEALWEAELNRRVAKIDSGESPGRPAEDVLADIRAKYS
jgi:putative addiction module component (TIGR02574 family)